MDAFIQYIPLIFSGIFFIAIIAGALIGFIQGLYKSVFYMLFTMLILIGGYFLIPVISNKLLDANLSFLNNALSGTLEVEVTTLRETIPAFLINKFPDMAHLFAAGTDTMALIFGVVKLAITLVLFLLLLVLNMTLFKLIGFLIWLIIKPRMKKSEKLMGMKKRKLRLFGAITGGIRGFFILLIVAIPFAGVFSIAENAVELLPLVENIETAETSSEFDFLADTVKSYRKSVMGQVYGVTIGDARFDERIFDTIFQIDVRPPEGKRQKIKLRKEINSIFNIVDIILEKNDYSLEFDISLLFKFEEEDIDKINKNIKNLETINVIKNIGLEYVYYELIEGQVDPEYENYLTLENLKEELDLKEDLTKIMSAIGVIAKSEAKEEVFENIFALTTEEASEVFDYLGQAKFIEVGLTIGVNILITSEYVDELIEEFNINKETIYRPTPEELIEDFTSIVDIYHLAFDVGFTNNEDIVQIVDNLEIIEDSHIEELLRIVFDFTFVYRNDDLFASVVYDQVASQLPEEFKDFVTQERIKNNFNAAELSHLAIIAKLLLEADAMDGDIDFEAFFTTENINKLSYHIAYSDLLSDGIEYFLEIFINEDSLGFTIEIPEDTTLKGEVGELELRSLLGAAKEILSIDFSQGLDAFGDMDSTKISSVATSLSGSSIVTYNLSNIIESLFDEDEDMDFQIKIPPHEDHREFWTKEELESIFLAFKEIGELDFDNEDFISDLEDEDIENLSLRLSSSKVIVYNLEDFVDNLVKTDEEDDGFAIVIPEYDDPYEFWTQEELEGIFFSVREVMNLDFSDDEVISDLSSTQIENLSSYLSSSKVMQHSLDGLVGTIGDDGAMPFSLTVPDHGNPEEFWTKLEIKSLFLAVKDAASLNDGLDSFAELTDNEIHDMSDHFTDSKVVLNNLSPMIDSVTENSEDDFGFLIEQPPGLFDDDPNSELRSIFKSFRAIAKIDLQDSDTLAGLSPEQIDDMSEHFTASKLLKSNLTSIVESIGGDDAFSFKIEIEEDDDDYWTKDELSYTLTAVSVFAEKDLDSTAIYQLDNEELTPVVRSKTIANSIKNMLHEETAAGGSLHGALLMPEDDPNNPTIVYYSTEDEKGELELFFNNMNALLGDDDDLEDLDLSLEIFRTTDLDLDDMFESKILEATAVELHMKPLVNDTLNKYLVNEYKDGTEFDWYKDVNPLNMRGDTIGLINAAIDLEENGLVLEDIDYDGFKDSSDDSSKTVGINDAFLSSNILTASLHKLLNEMLVEEAQLNVTVKDPDELSYWGELSTTGPNYEGELYFILDALSVGDGFAEREFDTIDNNSKDDFKAEIGKITASDTLRPILADMLEEEPLFSLDEFRIEPHEDDYRNPRELSETEWNDEINTLVEIIVILNDPTFSLDNMTTPDDLAKFEELKTEMDESLLYDTNKLIDKYFP